MTGSAHVLRANSRTLPLRDDSVDLVVTSPPYFALRSYQDAGEHYAGQIGDEPTPAAFVDSLLEVTRECMRVLKPSGSLWVNLGDKYVADNRGSGVDVKRGEAKHAPRGPAGFITGGMRQKSLMGIPWRYALRCIDELGLILRAEVIWSKPNGLPESVTDRVRRSHEQWFHFTLNPRYYSAVDEIREAYAQPDDPRAGHLNGSKLASTPGRGKDGGFINGIRGPQSPLGKLPGSVWEIATEPGDSIVRSVLSAVAADALTIDEGERILWAAHESRSWLTSASPTHAGYGRAGAMTAATERPQQSAAAARTGHIESPTSSSSDPSQTGSPSTISAETSDASTLSISSQSHAPRTSDALGQSETHAQPATASMTLTSNAPGMGGSVSGVSPVISSGNDSGDSVWVVPTEPLKVPAELGIDHFAAFPTEFPRRIIQGWSPAGVCTACGEGRRPIADKTLAVLDRGDVGARGSKFIDSHQWHEHNRYGQDKVYGRSEVTITGYTCSCDGDGYRSAQGLPLPPTRPAVVLDPFGGTGTTALVAKALGRHGISIDMSADYCRLATWRTNDPDQLAKAMRVDKPIKQVDGQISMLDLLDEEPA